MHRGLRTGLAVIVLAAVALSACAPAPTPVPTSPPARPAATTAPQAAAAPTIPSAAPTAAPASAPKPAAPAGEVTTIQWAIARNLIPTPIMVGVEKGIFLKHGFDVKLQLLDGAQAINKALQVGEAQIGQSVIDGIISARAEGLNVKVVGVLLGDASTMNNDNLFAIVAAPNSGITKPEDLAGKKIGVQPGPLNNYLLKVLAKANVPVDKVQIMNVPQANSMTALTSGVDAVATTEPYVELSLATVPGSKLVLRGGAYVAQRVLVEVMDDWLPKNRDKTERLLTGLIEAMQYTRQHQDEAAEIAGRWIGTGVDPAVMRRAIKWYDFDPRITPIVTESWASEDKNALEMKKTKRSVPFTEVVDPSLVEKIQKEHPEFYTDLKPVR